MHGMAPSAGGSRVIVKWFDRVGISYAPPMKL